MTFRTLALDTFRTVASIAILSAGVVAFAAITHKEPTAQKPPKEEQPLVVRTAGVSVHSSTLDLEADGLVIPFREIKVAAEVAGRVVYKSPRCRPGLIVNKGDVLAEIDRETYELEVQQLSVEVEQAAANLNELDVELQSSRELLKLAKEQLELRQNNVERIKSLSARQIVNAADVEDSRRQELEAINSVSTLQNQIAQIEAKKKTQEHARQLALVKQARAEVDLARTKIIAPADGVILECAFEENSHIAQGAQLCVLEDISAVEVRSNLRMEELQWILRQRTETSSENASGNFQAYELPATPVTVCYRLGGRSYKWVGKLVSYDGLGLDEQTRTVPVRIRVDDPLKVRIDDQTGSQHDTGPRALLRGMYVQVVLHVHPDAPLLSIPDDAVQPGSVVWCVRNGKLCKVPVTIAQAKASQILLDVASSQILQDDHLVISPMSAPVEGQSVREEKTL